MANAMIKRLHILFIVSCARGFFGPPQFDSQWLPLRAQGKEHSQVVVFHGLGEVPRLVDIQVKVLDGANAGFVFKAIGNGERDDDGPTPYGGVIYIYNEHEVVVMAPQRKTHPYMGHAVYTGDRSNWAGPNSQSSFVVNIRVRCWTAIALPPSCFNQSNIYVQANSSKVSDTFVELHHGLSKYPDIVKVRARLIDSLDKNWYTDAQGTSLWHRIVPLNDPTGGLKFGYSNASIRIWTSRASILYKREDGWGSRDVRGYAYKGDVDVVAWCDVVTPRVFSGTANIGPHVLNETLELTLPGERVLVEDVFVHAMMKVQDGNNEGFMFEAIGSAMTNTMFHGTPCMFGGVIVAFDGSAVRIWRPDDVNGAAVCIPDTMGDGRYSQAAFGGELTVVVYVIVIEDEKVYVPPIYMCHHFQRNATNTGYNSSAIATTNATSLLACDSACRTHYACELYTFNMALGCRMYNETDFSLVYAEPNTELWILHLRHYC